MQPLKSYRLGARFGDKLWYGIHQGQDYLPPTAGQKVPAYAVKNGHVIRSSYTPSCGNGVDIRLNDGVTVRYCHLSQRNVLKGQTVTEAKQVGLIGNTGLSRGVHLHLAAWTPNGDLLDPLEYLKKPEPVNQDTVNYYFKQIWGREPATGDWKYFWIRFNNEKWDRDKLLNTIKYWYSVVYPDGKLSKEGDAKWQRAKAKVL